MTLQYVMIGDIAIWFADDKPGLGWWHCAAIRRQPDEIDDCALRVVEMGGVLAIKCGCEIVPKPDNIAAVSNQFAREMGQSPDDVIISEAKLSFREVRLELLTADKNVQVFSRSSSAREFPFGVVLEASLVNGRASSFKGAIAGEKGIELRVVYDLEVELPFVIPAQENGEGTTSGLMPGKAVTSANYLESGSQAHPVEISGDVGRWFAQS